MKAKIVALAALPLIMAYAASGFAGEATELKWSEGDTC